MLGAIFKITKPGHVVVALLFVGVPTTVSLSSFLSLIRLRLLTDPERTNSPHFAKKKKIITCTFLSLWQSSAFTLTRGCITNYVVGIDGWYRTYKTEALQNSSPACTQK